MENLARVAGRAHGALEEISAEDVHLYAATQHLVHLNGEDDHVRAIVVDVARRSEIRGIHGEDLRVQRVAVPPDLGIS